MALSMHLASILTDNFLFCDYKSSCNLSLVEILTEPLNPVSDLSWLFVIGSEKTIISLRVDLYRGKKETSRFYIQCLVGVPNSSHLTGFGRDPKMFGHQLLLGQFLSQELFNN